MSYDPQDSAFDEMYESIGAELYPEHKEQAVIEFTTERLQSFYLANPAVMRPAVEALLEAKCLKTNGHHAAAVVFCATAVELFLKATLLKPIVHGLVHSPGLADVIVENALGQAGYARYRDLLSRLFQELASLDFAKISRDGETTTLIAEAQEIQGLRNNIIHKGLQSDEPAAEHAYAVAVATYEKVVVPLLWEIGLTVVDKGRIERRQHT